MIRKFLLTVVIASGLPLSTGLTDVGFREPEYRVPSSYDVLRFFHWKFRLPSSYAPAENSCEQLGFTEHIIAGTMISTLQSRLVQSPQPAFEEWFSGCAARFADVKLALMLDTAEFAEIFGKGTNPETLWSSLSEERKREALVHLIETWIGPDFILQELGLIGPDSTIIGKPQTLQAFVDRILNLKIMALRIMALRTEDRSQTKLSDVYRFYAAVILTLPELRIN